MKHMKQSTDPAVHNFEQRDQIKMSFKERHVEGEENTQKDKKNKERGASHFSQQTDVLGRALSLAARQPSIA